MNFDGALRKRIISVILVTLFSISSLFIFNTVRAIPVEQVVDVPSAIQYLAERAGTVLIQNIGRKVINEFAYDAATYVAAGGKGQKALFVTEKWSNFWKNIGDKATGDFIETFANTVLSDAAGASQDKEKLAACEASYNKCIAQVDDQPLYDPNGNFIGPQPDITGPRDYSACQTKYNACRASVAPNCAKQVDACNAECEQKKLVLTADGLLSCKNNCDQVGKGCSADNKGNDVALGNGSPLANINICNPRFDAAIVMGFGLTEPRYDPYDPTCSFSEMSKNWRSEYDRLVSIYTDKQYLYKLARSFDPSGNELGMYLKLRIGAEEYRADIIGDSKTETTAKGGWLDNRDLAGGLIGVPDGAKDRQQLVNEELFSNIDKVTGDIFVDAANIFINQLAYAGWRNLTGNLVDNSRNSSPVNFWSATANNRQAIENKITQIKDPVFSGSTRLNVLSELTICADPQAPGVNNCVIDGSFSDAITSKMTVAEALKAGNLKGDWAFGFDRNGLENLQYNQAYPYRSMLILRRYRIIPVGWEIAAQKIQLIRTGILNANNPAPVAPGNPDGLQPADLQKIADGVSFADMVNCYHPNDQYNGYSAKWCQGLVDPNWVLKLPDTVCTHKGYGPDLVTDFAIENTATKSCGEIVPGGNINRALVDGAYKNCSIDNDCCSRTERGAMVNDPSLNCALKCNYQEVKLSVTRSNDYCADEQSCIKEDSNGNCVANGYCTKERRQWVFDQAKKDQTCEPYANTCKTFKNTKGRTTGYLENTLDFNMCNANSSGCQQYSIANAYNGTAVAWEASTGSIYLNGRTKKCDSKTEGCHEFISITASNGVNLIGDGDFENNLQSHWDDYGVLYTSANSNFDQAYLGGGAVSLWVTSPHPGIYFNPSHQDLLPKGFEFEINQAYTLSADILVVNGSVELAIGNIDDDNYQTQIVDGQDWQNYQLNVDNDITLQANSFHIKPLAGAEFYLDNLKFEIGYSPNYSNYTDNTKVYQRLLPEYLAKSCYVNPPTDYSLRSDALEICNNFVRKCNKDEQGCEQFTDSLTKDAVTAKVKPKDYCPTECIGFDTFVQRENAFMSSRLEHFIPRTAKTCGSEAEGCQAFVNLDRVPEGGEENEYFAEFRRCIKPDNSCQDFYTWEGSDASGYQLTAYKLQANPNQAIGIQPLVIVDEDNTDNIDTDSNGTELCSETVFKYPADHPLANSDCRQFYSKDGYISYHLYSKTIVCADACIFYKQVDVNYDPTITSEAECRLAAGYESGVWKFGFWNPTNAKCAVCRNGGVWDTAQNACVFKAWAEESTTCARSSSGCSQYVGDNGADVKVIFNDTFENNRNGSWNNNQNPATEAVISTDALSVSGHSLKPASGTRLYKSVSHNLVPGKKYILSFSAKQTGQSAGIDSLKLVTLTESGQTVELTLANASSLQLVNRFRPYKFSLDNVANDSKLQGIIFDGLSDAESIRLDDIKLIEVRDVYYLLKDSWTTPESCNNDHRGRPFPLYMLGCRQYTDRDNRKHSLRSFDELCQDSAAGCRLMIDTFNTTAHNQLDFTVQREDGTVDGTVTVPSDAMTYVVYDAKKSCTASQKGCEQLGLRSGFNAVNSTWLLNNPDTYKDILCSISSVGCETWTADGNITTYFKDPGDKLCEYITDESGSGAWYQAKQKFCFSATTCTTNNDCAGFQCLADETGNKFCSTKQLCTGDDNCSAGDTCRLSSGTEPCDTTANKTIGLGVYGNKLQPVGMADGGNVGLCSITQNTCTEYIDPESRFNFNKFLDSDNSIELSANKLYIIKSGLENNVCVPSEIDCSAVNVRLFKINRETNELEETTNQKIVTTCGVDANGQPTLFSEEFYVTDRNVQADQNKPFVCTTTKVGSLREAVVAYRLKKSLDKGTPNETNFEKGQILFNERSQNGKTKKTLTYNTNLSYATDFNNAQGGPLVGVSNIPPGNNSNTLLQVDPDRVCDEWLDCKTYINNPLKPDEKICIERALCNSLNSEGECDNFIAYQPAIGSRSLIQTVFPTPNASGENGSLSLEALSNLTGYNKVAVENPQASLDLYHLAGMPELGGSKLKFDGSFEGKSVTEFVNDAGDYIQAIGDPRLIERELGIGQYRYVPDGQFIAKTNNNASLELDYAGSEEFVISAAVFLRNGSSATLSINDAGPVATTNITGQWTRLAGRFRLDNYNASSFKIRLKSNGLMYFDDVRIEPALNHRSDGLRGAEQVMASTCRLYPERNSMSCDYFDSAGLRRKGWSGYCLEYDPRNPNACLMWYPLDKVAAEEFEEGVALSISNDVYYCVDAVDSCVYDEKLGVTTPQPEFVCNTFVKVDKNKYWYNRIAEGSDYVLAPGIFGRTELGIDFGVDGKAKLGGQISTIKNGIGWAEGSGLYGAYNRSDLLSLTRQVGAGVNFNRSKSVRTMLPILPLYGLSRAGAGGKDDPYYCRATVNEKGQDYPFVLENGQGGSNGDDFAVTTNDDFDNCFVRAGLDGDFEDDAPCIIDGKHITNVPNDQNEDKNVCCAWNSKEGKCGISEVQDSKYFNGNETKTYKCLSEPGSDDDNCNGNDPRPWYFHDDVGVEAFVQRSTNNKWRFKCEDTSSDYEQIICAFDCFNHTNAYNVATDTARTKFAIQRLFTTVDKVITWKNGAYVQDDTLKAAHTEQVMPVCGLKDGQYFRPDFSSQNPTADYCYIPPQVFNIAVTPKKIVGQGYVAITFNTKVDSQQLPLKRIKIYRQQGVESSSFYRTMSIYDRPSKDSPHKFLVSYNYADMNCNPNQTCLVRPCVVIKDNWDRPSDDWDNPSLSACAGDDQLIEIVNK